MNETARGYILIALAVVAVGLLTTNVVLAAKANDTARLALIEAKEANGLAEKTAASAKALLVEATRPPVPPQEGLGHLVYSCQTSAMEATCTLTNPSPDRAANGCFRGIIARKGSSATAETMPVCTGELKPRETRTVSVHWTVGAVQKLCPNTSGYGIGVDWDACSFDVVDIDRTKMVKAAKLAAE